MHCAYAPQYDSGGNVVAFVAAITDITERKRVEQALLKSEELLKEADRRKDEFLAMLAHELRNPLAPIANAVQLLHLEEPESPVQRRARAIIDRQTGRLARLVDDLLEVSRISTGRIQLHMEQIAIGGILERAVESVRPLIEQHRHQLLAFIPSEPIWVHADAARLEQVFVNLLNNAAKYTDEGGRIEVSVTAGDAAVAIRVTDNGIGIEPELLPRVFDLFTQAERALDRSQGGLGIGLSLVHRLVAMHGGRVEVHSEVSSGSEFIVHLPTIAVTGAAEVFAQIARENEAAQSLRVLIVDDNLDAAMSLAMLLEASGHRIATAHTGPEALTVAAAQQPDVIFLDIGLPELDGYEVARRLREHQQADSLVIVAMTGYGQETDRARSHAAGFDHHLVKPHVTARS
jgi:CheY-like chemotaxis protein/nitrogen-specific signal transduction histidine kinase